MDKVSMFTTTSGRNLQWEAYLIDGHTASPYHPVVGSFGKLHDELYPAAHERVGGKLFGTLEYPSI
jgi:hypothetical protein